MDRATVSLMKQQRCYLTRPLLLATGTTEPLLINGQIRKWTPRPEILVLQIPARYYRLTALPTR